MHADCEESSSSTAASTVFDLGEIVVSSPIIKFEEANSIEAISEEQIRETGARNIAEALEFSPGVDSRIGGRGEARLNIRGLKQRQILIMADGVRYTEPYNNILDLKRLTTWNVSKIEVIKGAPSVLYGPYTLGGVVNIVGSKPVDDEYLITSEVEETGRWSVGIRGSEIDGDMYYLFSLRKETSRGYDLSEDYVAARNEDGGRRENSAFTVIDSELKIGGDTAEGGDWALTLGRRQNSFGMPPIDTDNAPRRYRYDNYDQSNVHFRLKSPVGERGELDFSGLMSHYYESYLDYYSDTSYTNPLYYYSTEDDTHDISLGYTRFATGGGPEIAVRGMYKSDNLQLISGRFGAGSAPPSIEDYDLGTFSLGMEVRWKRGSKTSYTAGTALNRFNKSNGPNETDVDATAGVTHNFSDRLGLRFSTGWKTRFPTPRELFEPTRGNPSLDPERAFILSAEIFYDAGRTDLTLGFFRNRISSLIAQVEYPDGSKYNMNVSKAVLSGMEFSVDHTLSENLGLWANYTYLNAMDKTPETDRDRIQYMPVWKLNYGLSYFMGNRLSLSFQGSHVGRQYYYYSSGARQQLSAFEVMNVRAEYSFSESTSIYAGVKNITDENYVERHGAPLAGRAFYMGMTFNR